MWVHVCVYMCAYDFTSTKLPDSRLASFSGLVRSLLAVQNSHRKPGLVHHVISAAGCVLRQQITMFAVVAKSVYNGVRS